MHSSIAQAPRVSGGKPLAETERDDLRDLLAAVRDALDIPPGHQRPAVLDGRVLLVLGAVRDVLDGRAQYIPYETELLRRKVAKDTTSQQPTAQHKTAVRALWARDLPEDGCRE